MKVKEWEIKKEESDEKRTRSKAAKSAMNWLETMILASQLLMALAN